MAAPETLFDAAILVLQTADPVEKADLSRHFAALWRTGTLFLPDDALPLPPDRPARPPHPVLLPPSQMPKRKSGQGESGRAALLHALAHIELNAIDLAWDIMVRFAHWQGEYLPRPFFDDWIRVADEEAKHFLLLQNRLHEMNSHYGALPAHDGLWESAEKTAHDFPARLAVVPMVLEARGLDVTPTMIDNLKRNGDEDSAAILKIIHDDEIGHVAIGKRWFDHVCKRLNVEARVHWQELVKTYFRGDLKPPFNKPSRDKADFPSCWYEPIALFAEVQARK